LISCRLNGPIKGIILMWRHSSRGSMLCKGSGSATSKHPY
jgi:hypothetical protein